MALLWLDDSFTIDQDIADAKALNDRIALSHPLEKLPQEAPADLILSAMQAVVEHFDLPEHYHTLLENVKAQIEHPELTIGGRLVTEIDHLSLETFGQEKGKPITTMLGMLIMPSKAMRIWSFPLNYYF